MKFLLKCLLTGCLLMTLCAACFAQASKTHLDKTANSGKASANTRLLTISDTLQYAIGAYIARWVNANGFPITNATLFLKGMDDVFQSKPGMLPDSLVNILVAAYQQSIQFGKLRKTEEQLFTALKNKQGVGLLPNGVYYVILKSGEGDHPGLHDSVTVHIRGSVADGTVFEDTYAAKQPVTQVPEAMIPGVAGALPMMAVGTKWQLFVPASLAYGDKGTGIIPPNTALVLEIELLKVKKKSN